MKPVYPATGDFRRRWGYLTAALLIAVLTFGTAMYAAQAEIACAAPVDGASEGGLAPATNAGESLIIAGEIAPALDVVRTASGDQPDEWAEWVVTKAVAAGPVTVTSSLQVSGERLEGSLRRLWLAALSGDPCKPGEIAALAVVPRTRGWLVAWELQLSAGEAGERTLGTVPLQAGRSYATILSYDPASGQVDVRIADGTAGTVVYQGQFTVQPVDVPVHAAAGILASLGAGNPAQLDVAELRIDPGYAPAGAAWRLARSIDGAPGPDQVSHIGAEPVGLWIAGTSAAGAGEYRLYAATGEERSIVLAAQPAAEDRFIPVPTDAFPPGPFDLVMEYVEGDRALFSESRRVVAGRVHFDFGRLRPDLATQSVTGTVTIRTEGPVDGVRLTIEAERTRLEWDQEARAYRETRQDREQLVHGLALEPGTNAAQGGPSGAAGDAFSIPLVLPLRGEEPGLWQVRFFVSADVAVPLNIEGDTRLFSTYPAAAEPRGRFTIAVLPDTQKYVRNYPHIFTRQTEWIASNTERLNTAFVLHLGDITDNNVADQWRFAQRSMGALDGVVPYVLTVGNHDMGNNGSADTRGTRLNEFFPWNDFSGEPWFGDSFEPGRLENSYYVFEAGGASWLVVALEFGPRDEVLEWANDVVAAHPDKRVIVVTHTYTTVSGGRVAGGGGSPEAYAFAKLPGASVNDGHDIWWKFVRHHPNILLVLSGHIAHDGMPRQVARGVHGNAVYEILMDYQHLELGGSGWLGLLQVDLQAGEVAVQGVSPYLGECKVGNFGGFAIPFVIDLEAEAFRRADPVAVAFRLERGLERDVECVLNPS